MKNISYLVKSPDTERPGEYIETRYSTVKELADDLEIGEYTIYLILNGACKFNHPSTKKIKDFIITKEVTNQDVGDHIKNKYKVNKNVSPEVKEYRKKINDEIAKLKQDLYEFEIADIEKRKNDFSKKFMDKVQNKTA